MLASRMSLITSAQLRTVFPRLTRRSCARYFTEGSASLLLQSPYKFIPNDRFLPRYPKKNTWSLFLSISATFATVASVSMAYSDGKLQNESGNFVFTTLGCPYCYEAKSLLKREKISYTEIRVDSNQKLREALATETGRKTVPVIFINGEYVGGFDSLTELLSQGKLSEILRKDPKSIPSSLIELASQPGPSEGEKPFPLSDRAHVRKLKLEQVASRMANSENGGIVRRENKEGRRTHKSSFSGADAVAWIRENMPDVESDSEAIDLCRELQSHKLLHSVTFSEQFSDSSSLIFRLHADEPPLSSALNAKKTFLGASRSAAEVAKDLRSKVLRLYEFALSENGRNVKYSSIPKSPQFSDYVSVAEELQKVDVLSLPHDHQTAFWLNVYNSLIIHAIAENGKPNRLTFYSSSKYNVGGSEFSLDDIEHGILRANRPSPASFFRESHFGARDPRRFLSIVPRDPRIHFALNCGARSCPPIRLYSGAALSDELDSATSAFCESSVEVDLTNRVVRLSKLFDWYKGDFGDDNEDRLRWLLPYLNESKRIDLENLLSSGVNNIRVQYSSYDWGVNE